MNVIVYGTELLFVEALAALLSRRGHTVRACPTSTEEILDLAAESSSVDAYLVDITSPSDADTVLMMKRVDPESRVVVLNLENDATTFAPSLEVGVDGICLKSDDIEEIERVLLKAARRPSSSLTPRSPVWSTGATVAARRRPLTPKGGWLTPKEREVLDLLIMGTGTAGIAAELKVSEATVRTHLQHLFGKFGVHSRIALIASAVNVGSTRSDRAMAIR